MRNRDNGIYLSKRTIYITIGVSLCLNAFFLLMGILIGKDDSKWDQQNVTKEIVPISKPKETKRDNLESELALFQPEDDHQPPKPLDLKPKQNTPKPELAQPKKPSTRVEASRATNSVKVSELAKLSPGYWVQVLAIDDKAKADDFKAKISKLGYPTLVIADSPYHKVLVGPHSDRRDAQRALTQINQRFKTKAWIRKI